MTRPTIKESGSNGTTSLPRIICVVGPTASGKSDLAVEIAIHVDGEVVSADSRQVYTGLNIGTGKVTKREMRGVPHHLLDVASPYRGTYSVTRFIRDAEKAIQNIQARGKTPILCGGTGYYINALIDAVPIPNVPPNPHFRVTLRAKTNLELFNMLQQLDPIRAATIDRNNTHRLIRAIEIAAAIGAVPALLPHPNPRYDAVMLGIRWPSDVLRQRIGVRLKKRLRSGMLAEAKNLHHKGLSWKRMVSLGLEYKFMALHLSGKMTKDEMVEQLETAIVHYAKRQMTWFKKDKRIIWLDSPVSERAWKEALESAHFTHWPTSHA